MPLPTRCCAGTVPMPFLAHRPSAASPSVTGLKPVHGVDGRAYENFSSCCREDDSYSQIVFDILQEMHDVRRLIKQIVETIGWMSQANVRQTLAAFQDELGQIIGQGTRRPAICLLSYAGQMAVRRAKQMPRRAARRVLKTYPIFHQQRRLRGWRWCSMTDLSSSMVWSAAPGGCR